MTVEEDFKDPKQLFIVRQVVRVWAIGIQTKFLANELDLEDVLGESNEKLWFFACHLISLILKF